MLPHLRMRWGTEATFSAPANARSCTLEFTCPATQNTIREKIAVVNGEFTIPLNTSCRMGNIAPPHLSCEVRVLWSRGRAQTLRVVGR